MTGASGAADRSRIGCPRGHLPPASTYRLQITPDFTLFDAAEQVDYLAALGVDWLYVSPILESGSEHGYDVVDPTRVDAARGGREGLEALSRTARAHGMGILVDIVPNHMGVGVPAANPFWWDVLTYGRDSEHAAMFDIDFDAADGTIILPELGEAADLEHLEIVEHRGRPALQIYDALYPVDPATVSEGIEPQALHERQHYRLVHWTHEDWELNYRRFFTIRSLAGVRVEDREVFETTHAEIESWFAAGLVDGLRIDHIDGLADPAGYLAWLRELTGAYVVVEKILALGPGEQREALPAHWATAGTTGYELIAAIDGALTHHGGFFQIEALRQHLSAGGSLDEETGLDIAGSGKRLQRHPTAVSGVLAQLENEAKSEFSSGPLTAEMLRLARDSARGWDRLDEAAHQAIGTDPLAAAEAAEGIAGAGRPVDPEQLADVFALITASLPVYRVYAPTRADRDHFLAEFDGRIDAQALPPLSRDGQVIRSALSRVRSTAQSRIASNRLLSYLGVLLTTADHPVAVRFAQTTGAVMAKGVEDTAFYRYCALTALNEVGGTPADPHSPAALGAELARRAEESPAGLNSLTTHDTKRGEDTRARILAIAEVPGEFAQFLAHVRELCPLDFAADASEVAAGELAFGVNASLAGARPATVDTSFEMLVWQAVLGAWPLRENRIRDYVLKAAREAGEQTTWTQPNLDFEHSVDELAAACAKDPGVRGRIASFDARIRSGGWSNALVAKALQLLAPGVPDVYNGTELWEQSLVDPDNRRPVDYAKRREILAGLPAWQAADAAARSARDYPSLGFWADDAAWETGAVKLALTRALLHLRRERRDVFAAPAAAPLEASGFGAKHVLAFAFGSEGQLALVGTRMPITLADLGGWGDTQVALPPGQRWRDVITGAEFDGGDHAAADLLRLLPVAVLERIR